MAVQIMLGPQSPRANLKNAIDSLSFNGPIVTITAGWRDSEAETDELQAEIGIPIEDLNLYHQAEKIFALEPELRALQRERQGKLLELQRLYRIRLTPTMAAARKLLREKGEPDLLRLEQRAAIIPGARIGSTSCPADLGNPPGFRYTQSGTANTRGGHTTPNHKAQGGGFCPGIDCRRSRSRIDQSHSPVPTGR